MHHSLGYSGPAMKYCSCSAQDLQYMCVFFCNILIMTNITCCAAQAFESDVLLDTDRKTVQRAYRFLVLQEVGIKFFCTRQGLVREKLSDAIHKTLGDSSSLQESSRNIHRRQAATSKQSEKLFWRQFGDGDDVGTEECGWNRENVFR